MESTAPLRPKSSKPIDNDTLREILFKAQGILKTRAKAQPVDVTSDLPEELSCQLTYGCNLRCSHCFQWGETGFHESLAPKESGMHLSFEVLRRCIAATRHTSPRILLWGGEPLIYKNWDVLVELLVDYPNDIVISTNGTRIQDKMASLRRLPPSATILVSLDGNEEQHDRIRGRGNYRRSIEGIRALMQLRRTGEFKGKVSIGAVVSSNCVPGLMDFCHTMEDEQVDAVYLVFPWFIDQTAGDRMDAFVDRELGWLTDWNQELTRHSSRSWDGYTFRVPPEAEDAVVAEVEQVAMTEWKMPVRFQPALNLQELRAFLRGGPGPFAGRSHCLSIFRRLSVLADGSATTCKLFPEMKYARLEQEDVLAVWKGHRAEKLRQTLSREGTPVCARCSQLYLDGMGG
jgi:sulfatase maturation enzyme AslB (radical SAM superfamily)